MLFNPQTTHLLIRHQEIALKGRNRPEFERRLCKHLDRTLGDHGKTLFASGRILVHLAPKVMEDAHLRSDLLTRLTRVSGVLAVAPCHVTSPDPQDISKSALEWARLDLEYAPETQTFAVRTRRVDKKFPLGSAEVDSTIGSKIGAMREGLTVNLKKPDLKLKIEIRQKHALIYSDEKAGVRGLPIDPTQRVVCLLSGGIDSPVAAYELMRRGCTPVFVHFHSKPFTSEASVNKVKRLAAVLKKSSPVPLELWLVPLLDIQKAVRDTCNERYRTVHYRRFMIAIAEELAKRQNAKALVTGEAIGQVASQTLTNLMAIEDVTRMPVLRPLIALDKDRIVEKAKELGTFEISVEPHDDTCVLFAPDRPSTQARLDILNQEAQSLPQYELIFSALDRAEKVLL